METPKLKSIPEDSLKLVPPSEDGLSVKCVYITKDNIAIVENRDGNFESVKTIKELNEAL